ncbi:glycosyltransferase [Aeromonas jandaei]|uniref:glycosyltransferase n=1 Tax=Aeromonas jandaei TaxID=650 RepID=UPI003B9FCE16
MKIAMIITGLGMGGAERQVCDLADQFIRFGHHILIISMTGEITNRPHSTAADIISLQMRKTPFSVFKAYWQAIKLLNQYKPDVVHSHMVHANIFARLLRLFVSFPKLICSAHSVNEGGGWRILAYRFTERLCDLNTNVSQEAVDSFVKSGAVPTGRMQVMYNGIDTQRFYFNATVRNNLRYQLGIDGNDLLLLSVGRLTAAKDYKNLLFAFAMLSAKFANIQLAIIGEGEEKAYLTRIAATQGCSERVHFLGLRYNVEDWMSAADIFVLSSAWEGFGLVVAEAMATERVVVATDCGGVREVVGSAGLLVPSKNSQQLFTAIEQAMMLSPLEREAMTKEARTRVINHYSIETICLRWLNLYKDYT